MKTLSKILSAVGLVSFLIGIILIAVLSGGLIWASYETDFYFGYGVFVPTEDEIETLSCPVLMEMDKEETISMVLENPSESEITPKVIVLISKANAVTYEPTIQPNNSHELVWDVSSDNVAFERMIAVSVFQYPTPAGRARSNTCSILVVDLPGDHSGQQILFLTIGLGLLLTLLGLVLWRWGTRSQEEDNERIFVALILILILTFSTLVVSIFEVWGLAMALLIILILLLTVSLSSLLLRQRTKTN